MGREHAPQQSRAEPTSVRSPSSGAQARQQGVPAPVPQRAASSDGSGNEQPDLRRQMAGRIQQALSLPRGSAHGSGGASSWLSHRSSAMSGPMSDKGNEAGPDSFVRSAQRALSSCAASQSVPSFFNDQVFSRAVASRAVSQAQKGRFPFGDQIAAETKGAIDPHAVPAAVVSDLPGLGVCLDGKVALRSGAGIDVARHELAHALGGNEAVADQASSDPSVLSALSSKSGPSIDGWKIGFEFQTSGKLNPKVYLADQQGHPRGNVDGNTTLEDHKGWKIDNDNNDMEVVTDAVDETDGGEKELIRQMSEIHAEMTLIQEKGDNSDKKPEQFSSFVGPTYGDKHGYVICHASKSSFTGRPQATVGVRFEAVPDLIHTFASKSKDKGVWAEGTPGWEGTHPYFQDEKTNHGQVNVRAVQGKVEKALAVYEKDSPSPRLRALLNVLVSYAAISQLQSRKTKYAKNIAAFMSRGNLSKLYNAMTPADQKIYQLMLSKDNGVGSMAALFDCDNAAALNGLKIFPKGLSEKKQAVTLTYGKLLKTLPQQDLIAALDDASIHVSEDKMKPRWDFDVGDTEQTKDDKKLGMEQRRGMWLELRALRYEVPWPEWRGLALQVFRTVRALNSPKQEVQEAPSNVSALSKLSKSYEPPSQE